MIPHYAPSFGPVRVMATMFSPLAAPSVADLEQEFTRMLGVHACVIVPSVRSAILMLLEATVEAETLVVGPAYTCLVVHEAMTLGATRLRYVEPSPKGFLMCADAVREAAEPGSCLVLSEMYGLPYSERFLQDTDETRPRLRILDMAMGLPDPRRLHVMRANDVALFSFGVGKAMCAGGGGVACFQDESLAATIRRMRDDAVADDSPYSRARNDLGVLASVAMRTRLLCRPATAAKTWKGKRHSRQVRGGLSNSGCSSATVALSSEWSHAMTALERRLALRNLRRVPGSARLRRQQAEVYVHSLREHGVLPDFDGESLPQSHFPVRVDASARGSVKAYLAARGIEVGEEFPYSGVLNSNGYPLAKRASAEVMTLPLGEGVSMTDVGRIAAALIDGLPR